MRKSLTLLLALGTLFIFVGCGPAAPGETGTEIIDAGQVQALLDDDAVLVDAQTAVKYAAEHIEGAVNISRADIVVNEPFPNLVAPAAQIEEVFSSRGIGNDTTVVVYDSNKNMDSARLWWTFKYFGHDAVKVVSGGLEALKGAGFSVSTTAPTVSPAQFSAAAPRSEMIADRKEVKKVVDEDPANTAIIDTRSQEEYNEGTIPGSVLLNFIGNNFADGTYRPVRQIRIRYLEEGIDYDDTIYMFCKTSIRGAQTYLALYNAGYRDLKLYDAAWVEWSANPMNPVYKPEVPGFQLNAADNS